jgi:NAD dependent epimerase/dehydratase family enzyme
VVLRLGVVLGPGGALPPLLLPIRLGLGGRMGSGQQVMSWIHRDDVLTLITNALQSPPNSPPMQGIYNATAPEPVPQATFAATAGQLLHRPVWLPVPANVVPARLQREGFTFAHPTLRQALRSLV